MTTTTHRIEQLEMCNRQMFGDLIFTCPTSSQSLNELQYRKLLRKSNKNIHMMPFTTNGASMDLRRASVDNNNYLKRTNIEQKRRASDLLDELLMDIYSNVQNVTTDYNSTTSGRSQKSLIVDIGDIDQKNVDELVNIIRCLKAYIERMGSILVRQLKRRDALRRQQDSHCDVITRQLFKCASEQHQGPQMRFSIQPVPGESGFSQWAAAMKMVAQLPGGIPTEFRYRLWLTLAERHLASRKVDWPLVEKNCFSEWSQQADSELGVQIVKDLHRTGCSLFCGEDGVENQALLKRVLLAYARWNKAVGYCQGFNMLAALILQVTDKNESDALKLMIYLIEGVLPDSYFADSLRGLSVDMAVFRELLKSRLPKLSRHLDRLQNAAKDGTTSYEPPLTNVFTMQWFLTLFCNCLPQPTVLRVWDLILLEGNEILLRTALAIWQQLAERIQNVRSADEFYCLMGVLTRELLEYDLIDGNTLIKTVVNIGHLNELKNLREHYLYNINPWNTTSLSQAMVDKQLKLYPRERLALDINALKKQYVKLKQRQRQAHIIFSAAITRQPPPSSTPVAVNHLLLGRSALVTAKRLGPPKGSIPPARLQQPPPQQQQQSMVKIVNPTTTTLHWKDTKPTSSSSSSSSDTELCDEDDHVPSSSSSSISSLKEDDKTCQLNDNPIEKPSESDNNLMNLDNTTTSAKVSASLLDLDDNTTSTSSTNIDKNVVDDENFDFELFLADRVALLKQDNTNERIGEMKQENARVNLARRNSERALQIIQENSIILHRILQCQSRLSPSPPPTEDLHDNDIDDDDDDENVENVNITKWLEENTTKLNLFSENNEPSSTTSPEQYGSKYTSILEKSKSLDERYNTLILNSSIPKLDENSELYSSKISPGSFSLPSPLYKCNPTWTQTQTTLEEATNLQTINNDDDFVKNESIIDSNQSTTCYSYLTSSDEKCGSETDDGNGPILTKSDNGDGSSSSIKMQEKIHFNPFPIPINSRQCSSKAVPLKLDLYKK